MARIQVQVEGPAELVAQSLRALPGVQRVEARGVVDGTRHVRPRGRPRAGRAAARSPSWPRSSAGASSSCKALDLSLEDVFIRIVAGEEHEEAMAAAAAGATEEVAS